MGTVLVVDNEPGCKEVLAGLLEQRGCPVVQVFSSFEVLELIRKQRPDAVVVCGGMDGLMGVQLLSHLQNSCPEVPVILVTGGGRAAWPADAGSRDDVRGFVAEPHDVRLLELAGLFEGRD